MYCSIATVFESKLISVLSVKESSHPIVPSATTYPANKFTTPQSNSLTKHLRTYQAPKLTTNTQAHSKTKPKLIPKLKTKPKSDFQNVSRTLHLPHLHPPHLPGNLDLPQTLHLGALSLSLRSALHGRHSHRLCQNPLLLLPLCTRTGNHQNRTSEDEQEDVFRGSRNCKRKEKEGEVG
jgi:hypothetical protein